MEKLIANDTTFRYPLQKCIMIGSGVLFAVCMFVHGKCDSTLSHILDCCQYCLLFAGAYLERKILVLIFLLLQSLYFGALILFGAFYAFGAFPSFGGANFIVFACRLFLFWMGSSYYYKLNNSSFSIGWFIEKIKGYFGPEQSRPAQATPAQATPGQVNPDAAKSPQVRR